MSLLLKIHPANPEIWQMGIRIARSFAIVSVATATLVAGATLGGAAIQTLSPGSGTTAAGGSVVATLSMDSADSCLDATTADPTITVGFSPACGGGGAWTSTMTILTTPQTLPVQHLVTITERSGFLGLPTDIAVYTLTVSAPAPTTTTTLPPTTTTVPIPTTTTTQPAATTTTTDAAATTTTQPGSITTTTQPGSITTTTQTASITTTTQGSTTTTTKQVGGSVLGGGEGSRGGSSGQGPIAFTRSLLGHFHPGPPRTIAAIVLSPLAVFEVLVRTLTASLGALAIPLALLAAMALWLLAARRGRRDRVPS